MVNPAKSNWPLVFAAVLVAVPIVAVLVAGIVAFKVVLWSYSYLTD